MCAVNKYNTQLKCDIGLIIMGPKQKNKKCSKLSEMVRKFEECFWHIGGQTNVVRKEDLSERRPNMKITLPKEHDFKGG